MEKVFLFDSTGAVLAGVADKSESILDEHCIILNKFSIGDFAQLFRLLLEFLNWFNLEIL